MPAAKVIAATVDARSGELRYQRLSGTTSEVPAFCAGTLGPDAGGLRGPTGFGLARALEKAGIGCVVAAPGDLYQRPGPKPWTAR